MIDYLEEILDQEEEEKEEPEELTGRPGTVPVPREGRAAPEEAAGEAAEIQPDPAEGGETGSVPEYAGAETPLAARVRAAEQSAAQSEAALEAAEESRHMPELRAEADGDSEGRTEEAYVSELAARVRTAQQRAAQSEAEAGAAGNGPAAVSGESPGGVRVYSWGTSVRRPGGGRALPEGTGISPLEEAVTELPEAAPAKGADTAALLRRGGGQGAEALYAGLTRLRAAAGYAGGRETVSVSLPEQTGTVTVRTGLGAADLDRHFQRDARRYDGGFTLY